MTVSRTESFLPAAHEHCSSRRSECCVSSDATTPHGHVQPVLAGPLTCYHCSTGVSGSTTKEVEKYMNRHTKLRRVMVRESILSKRG